MPPRDTVKSEEQAGGVFADELTGEIYTALREIHKDCLIDYEITFTDEIKAEDIECGKEFSINEDGGGLKAAVKRLYTEKEISVFTVHAETPEIISEVKIKSPAEEKSAEQKTLLDTD